MDLPAEFEAAAARAKSQPKQSNDVLLDLYSLFKQATEGDVHGEGPGFFDLVGQAKNDAWEERRGMAKDVAMTAYIELVGKLAGGR